MAESPKKATRPKPVIAVPGATQSFADATALDNWHLIRPFPKTVERTKK
jgi:hypothetical protein